MKYLTKLKLAAVQQLCEAEDRSTEYMHQLMQDAADVDLDCCISYFKLSEEEKEKLTNDVNSFLNVFTKIDDLTNRRP
jgi:hypothetical protein